MLGMVKLETDWSMCVHLGVQRVTGGFGEPFLP